MTDKIKSLEAIARQLDPGPESRGKLLDVAEKYSNDFLSDIATRRTYFTPQNPGEGLSQHPIQEEGMGIEKIISLIETEVDRAGLNPASGGHLGYIPGGGIFASAIGDFIADVGNNYAGVYFAGPGAVRMEHQLLRWIAEVVGYPATATGNLASGGSVANLIAIVTARDAKGLKGADFHRAVIYTSEQAHHCILKAVRIAGLGEAVVRHLPLDERFRIIPEKLAAQVKADQAAGLLPFLVVATAGTTDTGAVDPFPAIAEIAHANNMWLHIDAAYGGFFVLCEEGREVLRGMELSDSIVLDPHKTLFLPYGVGAVLVKDEAALRNSHRYFAPYLQDADHLSDQASPADLSPELTKHFRALRMWLPLMLHGLAPFRAALSEKILLCRYFYEKVKEIPGMETGPYPELSVATFRYVPPSGETNAFNKRLMEEIHKDGRVFLSSTSINGDVWIRIAVVAFRTHLDFVDRALEMLQDCVGRVHG